MTLEEFNASLGNLIIQKDSLNAQYTVLIQQISQHAQALSEYAEQLNGDEQPETTTDETTEATEPES